MKISDVKKKIEVFSTSTTINKDDIFLCNSFLVYTFFWFYLKTVISVLLK